MGPVFVTYRLSDIYGAYIHGWPRLIRLLIIIEILWMVLMIGVSLFDGWSLSGAIIWMNWRLLVFGGIALVAFWIVVCPLIGFWRAKRAGLLGPNEFSMVEKGIRAQTPKSDSVVYWSAIRRTVRTPSHFYLFLVTAGALIIPRRAFENEAAFGAFVNTAREDWEKGRTA